MVSEAEVLRKPKRSGKTLESKEVKKSKVAEKLTEEQVSGMIFIETDVLNVEPLQSKYPVVGWEIYSDDFGGAWKIIRTSDITSICRDFEDLVRSCDR